MKAATGELNLTVITLIAIAAIVAFFWWMWNGSGDNSIQSSISKQWESISQEDPNP